MGVMCSLHRRLGIRVTPYPIKKSWGEHSRGGGGGGRRRKEGEGRESGEGESGGGGGVTCCQG